MPATYPGEMKTSGSQEKDLCKEALGALFVSSQNWKQPKNPCIGEKISKSSCPHNGSELSTGSNRPPTHAAMWINLIPQFVRTYTQAHAYTQTYIHTSGVVCEYVYPSCKGVHIGMVERGMEEFTRVISFCCRDWGCI